jgi:oligopeptide/dipeptide ABC transporter ATP-binding protein
MSLLEIENLRLAFEGFEGTAEVLDGVSLTIAAGEAVGLVGESGCGKSVLARSVLRLDPSPPLRVRSGAIRFDNADVLAMAPAALRALRGAGVGMVFQDPTTYLNPVFTIGQLLADIFRAHPGAGYGTSEPISARSVALLRAVQLPEPEAMLARYPHQLSGGMRQRVLIAMALAGSPRLLIADEPTTALDVTIQAQILALLTDLIARLDLTLLLITHDVGVVGAICRRVAVMYAGAIVEEAPTARLFEAPKHPYTRGLLDAVPDLAHPGRLPRGIAGTIPSLRDPPPGCRFHPRCPIAMTVCRHEKPMLRAVGPGHRVACHAA